MQTVESLTSTPDTGRRNSRLWRSVAVGRSSMSRSKSLTAPSFSFGFEPGCRFGASVLPSWGALAYRLTDERLTPKERAA